MRAFDKSGLSSPVRSRRCGQTVCSSVAGKGKAMTIMRGSAKEFSKVGASTRECCGNRSDQNAYVEIAYIVLRFTTQFHRGNFYIFRCFLQISLKY